MRGFKAALAASIACATAFPAMPVLGQSATDGANVTVDGKFANVKTKDKPTGISGMACLPPSGEPATRQCLTVNDEENFAEIATLAGDVLKPTGRMVQLIGKAGEYPVSGVEATNMKKLATIYDKMEPEAGAQGIEQMVEKGKLDMAVIILSNMGQRQAAGLLSEVSKQDPGIAVQLIDRMRYYKTAQIAPK